MTEASQQGASQRVGGRTGASCTYSAALGRGLMAARAPSGTGGAARATAQPPRKGEHRASRRSFDGGGAPPPLYRFSDAPGARTPQARRGAFGPSGQSVSDFLHLAGAHECSSAARCGRVVHISVHTGHLARPRPRFDFTCARARRSPATPPLGRDLSRCFGVGQAAPSGGGFTPRWAPLPSTSAGPKCLPLNALGGERRAWGDRKSVV